MSRYVDTLPKAINPRDKKVIVLSFGRNGTLGLYYALQTLGYHPCHMRTVMQGGAHQLKLLQEATLTGRFGEGKPYSKEDLDKWIGEYDAVTDITSFVLEELVAAWPDAKFILTTRDEEAWYRSVEGTIKVVARDSASPVVQALAHFNPFVYQLARMTGTVGRHLWRGRGTDDKAAAIQTYREHNEKARRLVPAGQMIEIKLEDGLGWEQICPFLGKDIPGEPYPRINNAADFKEITDGIIKPNIHDAMLKLAATILVPAAAMGAWLCIRMIRK